MTRRGFYLSREQAEKLQETGESVTKIPRERLLFEAIRFSTTWREPDYNIRLFLPSGEIQRLHRGEKTYPPIFIKATTSLFRMLTMPITLTKEGLARVEFEVIDNLKLIGIMSLYALFKQDERNPNRVKLYRVHTVTSDRHNIVNYEELQLTAKIEDWE